MAIYKNVAGQKIAIYAHDTSADAPKTGDAANITATIDKDGAGSLTTNDTNPTEIAGGVYHFDMTQSETNADLITLIVSSATANVSIEPVIIYTLPTWQATQTAQTADHTTNIAAILEDTGTTIPALISANNAVGSGAISHTINVEVGGVDIAGASVWISSDVGGSTVVAGVLTTDAFGNATFLLDAGTYYVWVQAAGYNFTNPQTITVS